nr:zinc finger, CCHC-type [Tanacetum cinerariifolium]
MLEPVIVKSIFLGYHKSIVGNKLWRLGNVTSKAVLYINIGFNESGEYKKTFIGSGVGMGSMQVLHGFEFEVGPLGDHTFEVEPHENVDQGAGLQEMIWVLCKAEIWATKGLLDNAKENILDMKIVRDQSGNTLRVSQFRFYNRKLVQTLLEGHFILSLEGTLSEDCGVEKNGKWSCIYAVGSQEYQMVCTRPDIASADVGTLDGFDRGLQTYVQVFVNFDYAMVAYMTLTEVAKEAIWPKRLAIESGFELKIVASIATGALSKVVPGSRFQHELKLLRIEDF